MENRATPRRRARSQASGERARQPAPQPESDADASTPEAAPPERDASAVADAASDAASAPIAAAPGERASEAASAAVAAGAARAAGSGVPMAAGDATAAGAPIASAASGASAAIASLADPGLQPGAGARASAPDAATPTASGAVAAATAGASAPAFVQTWPSDTRLSYTLGGYYRGELHGSARVLWQRAGTRYLTAVEMSAGLLASLTLTSQGEITAAGLKPEAYEENVRGRRRGVRLGDAEVHLNNGSVVPRPAAVQDTASQFVELGHRFATGALKLEPGGQIRFSMARPGGIDDWVYDVVGEETLELPRLGAVRAYHLKPRRLDKPRGNITAEIWFAPSLQYLPVRIRIEQGEGSHVDLLVEAIEQR